MPFLSGSTPFIYSHISQHLKAPLIYCNHKNTITMNSLTSFLILFFLATATLSLATRPDTSIPLRDQHKHPKPADQGNKGSYYDSGGPGGFFGDIPGFGGNGWGDGIIGGGYGGGYGGPSGGSSRHGVVRPSVVCKDKGPCFNKKLTCPAKCFSSYGHSGKGYGGGGGGGGCTMDCKKKCIAYC